MSDEGRVNLTEQFEGLRLNAYPDPATRRAPWTIGYGHTGPEVVSGLEWSQAQAEAALMKDLESAEDTVNSLVVSPLTQNQFDSLVDFVFNEGAEHFERSTLLKLLNAGKFEDADAEFARWIFANGRKLPGLVARREAEAENFDE